MCPEVDVPGPERLVRFCGADCGQCETYQLFLAGDRGGLVNPETEFRCCWLPADYPQGKACPIAACCGGRGLLFCAECERFDRCEMVRAFYAQPGYEKLRERMLEVLSEPRLRRREKERRREAW